MYWFSVLEPLESLEQLMNLNLLGNLLCKNKAGYQNEVYIYMIVGYNNYYCTITSSTCGNSGFKAKAIAESSGR